MPQYEITAGGRVGTGRNWLVFLVILALAVLFAARSIAEFIIDLEWWKELGQLATFENILLYSFAPVAIATVLVFIILWIVHARALKHAGTGLSDHPVYSRLATLALLFVSFLIARASLDSWTTVSYFGAERAGVAANAWHDPIFGNTLSFYLFELPFYRQFLGLLLGLGIVAVIVYWIAGRVWNFADQFENMRQEGHVALDLLLPGSFDAILIRSLIAFVFVILAIRAYLDRYDYLYSEHNFLVGVDYLNQWVSIPLQWVLVLSLLALGALALLKRFKWMLLPVFVIVLRGVVPGIVSTVYVKPNEISLQKPYITNHINATRSAYALDSRVTEVPFAAKLDGPIDPQKNRALLDNVRLWDWRAFHDTVTQLQALRQYYVFHDTDVDRYNIDGNLRQVMITPRELDIRQLPGASANWINGHFIYTHGYGLVLAEANRITPNGQPVFFIEDAPPRIETPSLKLTRPELYYGEVTHEPVFVRTQQPEFNYPAGSDNVHTKYEGKGGIPISGLGMRLAAALAEGDTKVLLTSYLTPESRMLINRNVRARVSKLASFIEWDSDPYLVISADGRLVWVIDGYTTSDAHPYSRRVEIADVGPVNYIRNAVKATVDAYSGEVRIYVFDDKDPILRAFRAIFPALFTDASQMPADIRQHVRYPETLFRVQAEMYRTYHMRDPEAFYNREDLWDVAKNAYAQNNQSEGVPPTYVVATLPGETQPEFLLLLPFTPRSKDNLIGLMAARSDGEHLGEMVVLQLSKQSLIYGPLQVEARIDSDSNISKDLSLWNQQGSQVLRGQMLVLPINDTFLYVEPIYIQSSQARMPQLKKVVLAVGNTIIYRDTYEQALADLTGIAPSAPPQPSAPQPGQQAAAPPAPPPAAQPNANAGLEEVRTHMRRYRELSAQGKWAEAGRELEAIERLVTRQ